MPRRSLIGSRRPWETVVEADWSGGFMRDVARVAIPPGKAYDICDWLIDRPGVLRERGGAMTVGPALGAGSGVKSVAWAPFAGGAQLVGFGNDTHLYKVTSNSAATDIGLMPFATSIRPTFIADKLVYTALNQTPEKYNGAAISVLGGTPPLCRYSTGHGARLVLAHTGDSATDRRIYFSPLPDIESTWDTANSYIDCQYSITGGLASLPGRLLCFSEQHVEIIVGTTPPPNSDMSRTIFADIGCTDSNSIVTTDRGCFFANVNGVYFTDGVARPECLTDRAGIGSYWRDQIKQARSDMKAVAAGVLSSDYLFVTITKNTGFQDGFLCYLPRNAWVRFTNITANNFATGQGGISGSSSIYDTELYAATSLSNKILTMSNVLERTSTNPSDLGTSFGTVPVLETRPIGGLGLRHFGRARLTYDMRSSAQLSLLNIKVADGVEAPTYTAVSESPLGTTTNAVRRPPLTIAKVAQALSFQITRTGSTPSDKTEIYALEVEQRELPPILNIPAS